MDPADDASAGTPRCGRCGAVVSRGRAESYLVEIRAVADPSPPRFTPEDLEADTQAAIDDLLRRLRKMSESELNDQVYRRELYVLCAPCYRAWIASPFGPSRSST